MADHNQATQQPVRQHVDVAVVSQPHNGSESNTSQAELPSNPPEESSVSLAKASSTRILEAYLERIAQSVSEKEWPRVPCPSCENHPSRHVYCFDCCQLLIPSSDIPPSIQNNLLQLPFALDILLQDRRASSTGVQMATLLKHHADADHNTKNIDDDDDAMVRLIDLEQHHPIPNYDKSSLHEFPVVLFPCPDSMPLSSIQQSLNEVSNTPVSSSSTTPANSSHDDPAPSEQQSTTQTTMPRRLRLIVLDCKWNSYRRILERLNHLPKVHLEDNSNNAPTAQNASPRPRETYYWRWHNAGPGCLSSAEAVFWAAWDWNQRNKAHKNSREQRTSNSSDYQKEDSSSPPLLDLLWLFAVQRALITKRFQSGKESVPRKIPHLPFSQQAKEEARALRRKQGEEFKRQQNEKRKQQRSDQD